MSDKKNKVTEWNAERKARKQAKRDEFWAPYRERRVAAESEVGGFLSQLWADYRFVTVFVLALAVVGFFLLRGLIDAVAVVGALAMIRHWNDLVGTPEQIYTPGFGFWRVLSYISLVVAVIGTIYGVVVFVQGVMAVGFFESFKRL